jgi:hypothetical protein
MGAFQAIEHLVEIGNWYKITFNRPKQVIKSAKIQG